DTATGHVGDAVTTGLAPRDASQRPGATPQSASSAVQTAGGAPQAVSAGAPLPTQATAPKGLGAPGKPAAESASAAAALGDTQAASPPGGTVAQSAPGPVLTPAQIQARVLKRKALGLEGAMAAKIQKQELAEDANRVAALMQKDRVENAGPAVGTVVPQPVQPVQWSQPAAQASDTVARNRPAASRDVMAPAQAMAPAFASNPDLPALSPSPRAATAIEAAMHGPVEQLGSAMDARSSPAGTPPLAAIANVAPQASQRVVQPQQAAELAPADLDPFEASLDASDVQSPEMTGAPPAPVRQQREERIAEAIGAQLMAQQARIELVNVPELAEVIKKI
ncbi:MAG: hypothetical protein Q8R82_07445, partial [Hyphomonadaceae bacterium]|nr:hypothetical protein [Hyphomonadaceae bacterium]